MCAARRLRVAAIPYTSELRVNRFVPLRIDDDDAVPAAHVFSASLEICRATRRAVRTRITRDVPLGCTIHHD